MVESGRIVELKNTMGSGEISVFGTNVLELACRRVRDLNVAGDVSIAIGLAELIECLIGNIGDVQFMIAYPMLGSKTLTKGIVGNSPIVSRS